MGVLRVQRVSDRIDVVEDRAHAGHFKSTFLKPGIHADRLVQDANGLLRA